MNYRMIFVSMFLMVGSTIVAGAAQSSHQRLRAVPFTKVTITDAFWSPRIETNRKVTIPFDFRKCEETGRISNFSKAAGLMKGDFEGKYYNDSDVYKIIEGAAYSLSNHPDAELEKYVDGVIDKIAAAQWEDGYLYTFYSVPAHQPGKRWSNIRGGHELYCAGHFIESAAAYYQATGKRKILNVAIKLADKIDSVFGPGKKHGSPGHEEIELALVKLYRLTGEKRYLNLANFFLDERGRTPGIAGRTYDQSHKPLRLQSEVVGHAVRAMYLYAGVADVAAITGDEGYITAMKRLWENLIYRKLYITGGIGASRRGEAFGKDYYLPNAEAYAETCAAVGVAMWSHRLNLMHGEASYFDVFERALYNGLLSGVSLDGEKFFYVNPLESDGLEKFNADSNGRKSWFTTSCCPTNIARFLPSLSGYVYAVDNEGVYVNLYVTSTSKVAVKNRQVTLLQETRYPWEGRVKLTVNPEQKGKFNINIRIPGWCRGEPVPSDLYRFADTLTEQNHARLKINGEIQSELEVNRGYVKLTRNWKKGDVIELNMPMPVRRVAANEKVKDDRAKVALQRGPIVYCLEEVDNGNMVRNLYLPPESELTSIYQGNLLGAVVVVKGRATVRKAEKKIAVPFTAVPYYSWNNRGAGQMVVWLTAK